MNFEQGYYQTGNYANYLQRRERYVQLAKEIEEYIEEPVIDFGCGVGFLADALQAINVKTQGYDVSEWAITYGLNMGFKNLTKNKEELEKSRTLVALDVFEHMELAELKNVILDIGAQLILVRIPVAKKSGGKFVLEVSNCDETHITCLTKFEWEEFFFNCGYKLKEILNCQTIWDSEGVLSRVYVKSM